MNFNILANMLTLVSEPQPGTGYTRISVRVGVGSSHEPAELRGISHFLEHMLFRGTKRHPTPDEQGKAAELLGSVMEAHTSDLATVYSISVRPECLRQALDLLRDMFETPLLADIELERNIVQEEILESLDDEGRLVDALKLVATKLYPSDPRGLPIYGSPESVSRISEDDLRSWLERHYVGSNMICIITGEFDDADARYLVAESLGKLKAGTPTPVQGVQESQDVQPLFVENTASQTSICVAWRVNTPYARHAAAFSILASLLGGRMFKSIVQDMGLCYHTSMNIFAARDCVSFVLNAECAPENSDDVTQALLSVPSKPFSRGDLERHVSTTSFELVRSLATPDGLAAAFLDEIDFQAPRARSEDLYHVTEAHIEEVRQLIDPDNASVVVVGP